MKTKGISIWEQHLERIVLGIAVLVFVALTALQFVGDPNATQVNGQDVSPGEVDDMVKTEAERLRSRLTPEARSAVEFDDPEPILDDFEGRRLAGVSPGDRLARVQHPVVIGGGDGIVPMDEPFRVPEVPKPYDVASTQYFDAISEDAVSIVEEQETLREMIAALPHDLTWITTAARFDVADVLAMYATDEPDARAIPLNWYEGRIDIVDVRVEREEYIGGEWTNPTTIEPIPGQVSFRVDIADEEGMDAAGRDWVLNQMADEAVAADIVQPEFYPTVNESWTAPSYDAMGAVNVDEAMTEEELEIVSLRKQIVRQKTELDRVSRRLEDLGGELEPDPPDNQRSGGPPSGRSGGGGTGAPGGDLEGTGQGGGGAGTRGGQQFSDNANKKRRIALTKKKRSQERRLEALEQKLAALIGEQAALAQTELVEDEPEKTITVWAHDLAVEPGKTYRYRFSVEVFNPFCARRISLIEDQHHLADGLAIRSEPSEWSEAIYAEPPLRVFITGATGPGQGGGGGVGSVDMGVVSAEVYRFYNSRWWRDDVRVSPGDRIGGIEEIRGGDTEIDFRSDWFLLDVVSNLTANRQTRDRRWAARALLQNLNTPERIVVRWPAADASSDERQQLKEEVDLAEQNDLALAE